MPTTRPSQQLLACRRVVLDPVFVDGTQPPQAAWNRVVARLQGILPGELVVHEPQWIMDPGQGLQLPEFGPHQVTLVFMPSSRKVHLGYFSRSGDGHQYVHLNKRKLERLAGPILRKKAWELVMTHELGHAMGVPQDAGHDDGTSHCTNPRCVMYRCVDAKSLTAALFHGLPLDFCPQCQAELTSAPLPGLQTATPSTAAATGPQQGDNAMATE